MPPRHYATPLRVLSSSSRHIIIRAPRELVYHCWSSLPYRHRFAANLSSRLRHSTCHTHLHHRQHIPFYAALVAPPLRVIRVDYHLRPRQPPCHYHTIGHTLPLPLLSHVIIAAPLIPFIVITIILVTRRHTSASAPLLCLAFHHAHATTPGVILSCFMTRHCHATLTLIVATMALIVATHHAPTSFVIVTPATRCFYTPRHCFPACRTYSSLMLNFIIIDCLRIIMPACPPDHVRALYCRCQHTIRHHHYRRLMPICLRDTTSF